MPRDIINSLDILSKSNMIDVWASFTRPNNTTQYSNNDLMHSSLDMATVSPLEFAFPDWAKGLSGYVGKILAFKTGDTTTNCTMSLRLYSLPPRVNHVDNTPFNIYAWTDRDKFLGVLGSFTFAASVAGGGCYANPTSLTPVYFSNLPNNILYAYVQMGAAYTPAALEQFEFHLGVVILD